LSGFRAGGAGGFRPNPGNYTKPASSSNRFQAPDVDAVLRCRSRETDYNAQAELPGSDGKPPAPPAVNPDTDCPSSVARNCRLRFQHSRIPNCVFQLLKKQYSRYTPEMVERITGISKEQFLKAPTSTLGSQRRRHEEGQHHHLRRRLDPSLIWNANHPHRGHPATVMATSVARARRQCSSRALQHSGRHGYGRSFDSLPGYLKCRRCDASFADWMKRITPTSSKPPRGNSFNYYSNTPKFVSASFKALYGDAATKQNGWAFDYLPKVDQTTLGCRCGTTCTTDL